MATRDAFSQFDLPLLSSRPATVDRLHLFFFIISVPVAIIIVILFILLYAFDAVNAHTAVFTISGFSTGASVGMTGLLILCHLTVYVCPVQQRLICRILLLVPVNALDSLFALLFLRISTVIALIRDTYEAYVIYQFYLLLMEYLGGESRVLELWRRYGTGSTYADSTLTVSETMDTEQMSDAEDSQSSEIASTACDVCPQRERSEVQQGEAEGNPSTMRHVFPMNLCCSPVPLNGTTLYLWKLLLTQYVILNPMLTLLTIPLYFTGFYHAGSFSPKDSYPYLATLRTISVTLAMSSLVYFYFATRNFVRMHSPTLKFVSIKLVVFLSFWQGVLLSALVFYRSISDSRITAREFADGLQNFIMCIEMFLLSIVHRWVFSDDIYIRANNGCRGRLRLWTIRHVLSIGDVIDEAGSVVRSAARETEQMIRRYRKRKKRGRGTPKQSMETEGTNPSLSVSTCTINVNGDI